MKRLLVILIVSALWSGCNTTYIRVDGTNNTTTVTTTDGGTDLNAVPPQP